ncbi:MAG: hypothetical protein NC033_00025 [Clostridiales bacterium]|nr:hypothetical protein [Clostridiales bacterium]
MKKTKKALLAALAISVAAAGVCGLAACDSGSGSSGHSFSSDWSYDSENVSAGHWHACTAEGHTDVSGTEKHEGTWVVDSNDATKEKRECTKCHAVETRDKHTHAYTDWVIDEDDLPTDTREGKATRECEGTAGTCEDAVLEYTLPVLTSQDYAVETLTELTCSTNGRVNYTLVTEDPDDEDITFQILTESEGTEHTWREEWHSNEEGHFHICNHDTHESTPVTHDNNGEHGECSVCGYFAPVTIEIENGQTSGTLENVYVDTHGRVLKFSGLQSGHSYTLTSDSDNLLFCQGIKWGLTFNFDHILTGHETEEYQLQLQLLGTVSEDDPSGGRDGETEGQEPSEGEEPSVEPVTSVTATITITDNGETDNSFPGQTITLDQEVTIDSADDTIARDDDGNYVFAIELQAGKYQVVVDGSAVDLSDMWASVMISSTDPVNDSLELVLTFDGKAVEIDSAATYYVLLDSSNWNATFKVIEAPEGGEEGGDENATIVCNKNDGGAFGATVVSTGTTITFSGYEVGKTYTITVMGANKDYIMVVDANSQAVTEFTYEEGLTLTAKSPMPGTYTNLMFSVQEKSA